MADVWRQSLLVNSDLTAMANQKYYPQLDTLRTFAAFGVIHLHWLNSDYPEFFGINDYTWKIWSFGHFGVQLFFVLSAFLITDTLIKYKNEQSNGRIIRNFYVRRALRLFPIYYLFLLFLVIVKDEFVTENMGWFLTYTANFKFYHVGGMVDVWSNHLWTLSIEEQFYLAFPLILLLMPGKHEMLIAITLIVGALVFKSVGLNSDKPLYLITIAQMDMLGAGVALALLKNRSGSVFDSLTGLMGKAVMIISLLACLVIYYFAEKSSVIWVSFDYLLIIAFALLVANTTVGFTGITGRIFSNGALRYLGKVSYGLYLYHKVVPLTLLIILNKLHLQLPNIYLYYVINLAILLLVTHFSWILIEKPLLKLKNRFEYQEKP